MKKIPNKNLRKEYEKNPNLCADCNLPIDFDRKTKNKCLLCSKKQQACPECKLLFSIYGIKNHISKAHGKDSFRGKGIVPWNKGLTKIDHTSIEKQGETYSENFKLGLIKVWSQGLTKETSKKLKQASINISKRINEKVEKRDWHNSFSKSRTHIYKGIPLYGMWEVKFATFLDEMLISWLRPEESFQYVFEGKDRRYTPDFLLPENLYVEIKGYPTLKDLAKWKYFPYDLRVVFGRHLKELKIIDSCRAYS